jgi:hypothetical protein
LRSSFERVAHAVGALFVSAQVAVEDALVEAYEVPAVVRSIMPRPLRSAVRAA